MKNISELLPNDSTIQRRRRISSTIENAVNEDPLAVAELLQVIGKIYKKGTVSHFWDLVAALSGADRGYGNDWFYTAIEILERKQNEK